jgi:hypothetical protein
VVGQKRSSNVQLKASQHDCFLIFATQTILRMKNKLAVFPLLTILVALSACDLSATGDPCGNEVSQTVISPSGKLKAVVFNRNCGATTGDNTQVSIIPAAEALPGGAGHTLILDGTVPLKIEWRSNSELHLGSVGAAKPFLQSASAAGVSIRYGG